MSLHFRRKFNIKILISQKRRCHCLYDTTYNKTKEDLIEKMIENDYIGNYELENMVAVLSCQANIQNLK